MEGEVIEGFICPICYKDMKTASSLFNHVQNHSQSEQNLLKSVKGLYEKAKQRMQVSSLQQSSSSSSGRISKSGAESSPSTSSKAVPGYPASEPSSLATVAWRSHTSRFKAIRDFRNERYASQTNVLLIRLSKLMQQLPTDPAKRKAFEQNVVPWVEDADVALCPDCAKPFNLLKRKHHCRLCGSVMCRNCTFLLSLESAQKMVGTSANSQSYASQVSSPTPLQLLAKPVLGLETGRDNHFPLCQHCYQLLSSREAAREHKNERSILVQFYERLREAMASCDTAVADYLKIYNSLCAGETTHTLTEAQTLRIQLLRMADTIDSTSKKIAILGQNSDSPPEGIPLKVQLTIRNAVALYLKKNVVSLPSLPSEEDIERFQTLRRQEIERRLEEERRRELEEEERVNRNGDAAAAAMSLSVRPPSRTDEDRKSPGQVTMDEGWTPRVKQAIITDDPLLEQIGILHGFIEQAERAGRADECEALRLNLMELEDAFDNRQAEQNASAQVALPN